MNKKRKPLATVAGKTEVTGLKHLVRELKAQNSKLQRRVAKLEAETITARNRIRALEKQKLPPSSKPTSDIEVARRIAFLLNKAGIDVNGNPTAKKPS